MAKPTTAGKTRDAGTVSVRFLDILLSRAASEGLDRRIVTARAGLDDSGNRAKAAAKLAIGFATLYRKLKAVGGSGW